MNKQDLLAFTSLFKAICEKCFAQPLSNSLTEPESRQLSHEIELQTGLVVGWKSIKNYAAFVLQEPPYKPENPSLATLDTLARYHFEAPLSSEVQRKKSANLYIYWFKYRDQINGVAPTSAPSAIRPQKRFWWLPLGFGLVLFTLLIFYFQTKELEQFYDDFSSVEEKALLDKGWFVQSKETNHWDKRGLYPEHLTLFTLKGDNWPQKSEKPTIRNLLLRKIQDDCFNTEVHFSEFIPHESWQQAGLLLLEDTTFTGKSIRLSLSYNNFFGGYSKPGEIIIQGIASLGKKYSNLEEMIHQPLFAFEQEIKTLIVKNLKNSALKIEKKGQQFRFLYSSGDSENFSFKELKVYEFDMMPKYVGIFALKGFVDTSATIPAKVKFFRLEGRKCKP